MKGRGASGGHKMRFRKIQELLEEDSGELEVRKTEFLATHPKTLINKVENSAVPFAYSMNPYQGCEHGCIYCYARVTHEYWDYNAGIDFESKILVKENCVELFKTELEKKSWKVAPILLSGNTDCYQPIERRLKMTRSLLEVALEYNQPIEIITKNALILRDLDVLTEMAKKNLIVVNLSVTTTNEELRRIMEPRTSTGMNRFETVYQLNSVHVPTNVMIAPVIPFLNSDEVMNLVKLAFNYGARNVSSQMVRVKGVVLELFEKWLEEHFPDRTQKVLNHIAEFPSEIGNGGRGNFEDSIYQSYLVSRRKYFGQVPRLILNCDEFKVPTNQLELFE